jgi:hypothetical protein
LSRKPEEQKHQDSIAEKNPKCRHVITTRRCLHFFFSVLEIFFDKLVAVISIPLVARYFFIQAIHDKLEVDANVLLKAI